MTTIRRIFATVGITAALYTVATALFGALGFAHALITITAIDHWHPNWPDPATVDDIATILPTLTTATAIAMLIAYIATAFLDRWFGPSSLPSGMSAAARFPVAQAMAGRAVHPYKPTRADFHADLAGMLRDAGCTPDDALAGADAAMLSADTDDPADWAGRIRQEALNAAGVYKTYVRIFSREPRLAETARFLQDYGYRALVMKRVEGSMSAKPNSGIPTLEETTADFLNFDGLLVFHRTPARAAEEALIELLISAHQAYMASMDDNGEPAKREGVEQYAKALRHVCTKLALRGFVPPELDAEIGRDGTATAEELERWAIAQVVAACSPMTRMPLPTIERTTGGV